MDPNEQGSPFSSPLLRRNNLRDALVSSLHWSKPLAPPRAGLFFGEADP